MSLQKPRGTKDLYGNDLLRTKEIIQGIKAIFTSYGYTEIQTPIFEHIEVFSGNDSALLGTNKEFFNIKSRDSDEVAYVLRPENTASLVRALVENKLINKQVDYTLRYFYEGPFFRYERPQSGRFRQFTQLGIEKINTDQIEDDIENLLLVQDIQNKFSLNLELRLNYLGDKETKQRWNERLKEYFEPYREQLSPISQKRITENPLRILDDKLDSKKDFVKNAPKIDEFLSSEDRRKLERIKELIEKLEIKVVWDSSLVRGIDYYTGLIYEWIDPKEEITLIAGGRYDQLFERFQYSTVPSLGLAIGIERLKLVIERDNEYEWTNKPKHLYLYPKLEANIDYYNWIAEWRDFIVNNSYEINLIVSYQVLTEEKHKKLAKKCTGNTNVFVLGGGEKGKSIEELNLEFMAVVNKIYEI